MKQAAGKCSRDEVESSSAPNSRENGGSPYFCPVLLQERVMSLQSNTTYRVVFLSCTLPTRKGHNWMLPVRPSWSPAKTLTEPISSHCSYANGPWTHRGPRVCVCVCVASLSFGLLCNEWVLNSNRLLTGHTERNTVVTQWTPPRSPQHTHTQSHTQSLLVKTG